MHMRNERKRRVLRNSGPCYQEFKAAGILTELFKGAGYYK